MDETKITAKLPHLDVEITRRELPEENAETITLRMTAVPSFDAFAGFLMQLGNLPLSPFAAEWTNLWMEAWATPLHSWTRLAESVWAPWLQPMTRQVEQIPKRGRENERCSEGCSGGEQKVHR